MKTINNLTQLSVITRLFSASLSCIAGKILVSCSELPLIQVLFFTISFGLIWRYILTILKKNYDEHRHFQCNCSVEDIWRDF